MAGKRPPTSDLNHENWNDEEEPEEVGTFKQASPDELNKRKILRPKRKLIEDRLPGSSFNPFTSLSFSFGTPIITSSIPPVVAPADSNSSLIPGDDSDSDDQAMQLVSNHRSLDSENEVDSSTGLQLNQEPSSPENDVNDSLVATTSGLNTTNGDSQNSEDYSSEACSTRALVDPEESLSNSEASERAQADNSEVDSSIIGIGNDNDSSLDENDDNNVDADGLAEPDDNAVGIALENRFSNVDSTVEDEQRN